MNIRKSTRIIAFFMIALSSVYVLAATSKRSIDENRVINTVK